MPARATSHLPEPPVDWIWIAKATALVGLMVLCYWQTLDGGFIWDDQLFVPTDPGTHSWKGLRDIWQGIGLYDYYPLTYTAFWIGWQFWGNDPLGYHVVGLLFGTFNVFLLWALAARLRLPGAWLAAVIFAVHPLNVSTIAWIAEAKNTLSAAFYLSCLLCFVRAADAKPGESFKGWYAASVLSFLCANLSKTSVVMLPFVLLLLIWWRIGRLNQHDLRRTFPFFLISFMAGLLTIWFHHARAMAPDDPQLARSLPARVFGGGHALLFYIGKWLLPSNLSMVYPRWHPSVASAWVPLALVTTVLAGALMLRERLGRGPAACFAYFLITLLPVCGLVPASMLTSSEVLDHLAYLATMGAAAGTGALLMSRPTPPGRRLVGSFAAMLIVGGLVAGSLARAHEFSSPESLWRAALAVAPGSIVARSNLGTALIEKKDYAGAEIQLRAALRKDPELVGAAEKLADVLRIKGGFAEAANLYSGVVGATTDPKDFNNYGVVLMQLGEPAEASEAFRASIRLAPRLVSPHFNLYHADLALGDVAGAVDELGVCLLQDPTHLPALRALWALDLEAASPANQTPEAAELLKRIREIAGENAVPISAPSNIPIPNATAIEARIATIVNRTTTPARGRN